MNTYTLRPTVFLIRDKSDRELSDRALKKQFERACDLLGDEIRQLKDYRCELSNSHKEKMEESLKMLFKLHELINKN